MTHHGNDDVRVAIEAINARRTDPLRLVRRFAVGDGAGAYAVETPAGDRHVLKWWPSTADQRERSRLRLPRIERLRELGWPIPRLRESGRAERVLFELGDVAPGQPGVDLVPASVVDQASNLIGLARGAALGDGRDWAGWIERFIGNAIDSAAAKAGADGLHVLDVCRQAVAACTLPAGRDIIHGDFGPANCLVEDGRIRAVVDFDACRDGDGTVDLIGLAWDLEGWEKADPVVLDRLWANIRAMTTPETGRVFAAFWIAGSMAWSAGTEYEAHIVAMSRRTLARFV